MFLTRVRLAFFLCSLLELTREPKRTRKFDFLEILFISKSNHSRINFMEIDDGA